MNLTLQTHHAHNYNPEHPHRDNPQYSHYGRASLLHHLLLYHCLCLFLDCLRNSRFSVFYLMTHACPFRRLVKKTYRCDVHQKLEFSVSLSPTPLPYQDGHHGYLFYDYYLLEHGNHLV